MPIKLHNINDPKPQFDPRFFDNDLTGSGGSVGLLGHSIDPCENQQSQNVFYDSFASNPDAILGIRKETQLLGKGQSVTKSICVQPISYKLKDLCSTIPFKDDMLLAFTGRNVEVWLDVEVSNIFTKTLSTTTGTERDKAVCYLVTAYVLNDSNSDKALNIKAANIVNNASSSIPYIVGAPSSTNYTIGAPYPTHYKSSTHLSFAPVLFDDCILALEEAYAWFIDEFDHTFTRLRSTFEPEIQDFLKDFSVYKDVTNLANQFNDIDWMSRSLDAALDGFVKHYAQDPNSESAFISLVSSQARHLSNYQVPIEIYNNFYNSIRNYAASISTDPELVVDTIIDNNVYLLLSQVIANLNSVNSNLPRIPASTCANKRMNFEQKAAIEANDPLILVQSAAGTGKTTTITGRLDHMQDNGVELSDVIALSFTNAAADELKARYPQLNSITIASMIHTIYSLNHPDQQLSSPEILANVTKSKLSLPFSEKVETLLSLIKDASEGTRGASLSVSLIELLGFVRQNKDFINTFLDTIGQTTLELEIVMSYLDIDTMKIPSQYLAKHLIIDEVQDNSIFEFVFLLKYVSLYFMSLFVVGDSSQTLYEFRSANPHAINMLESTGIFKTFKLQINYRSNQCVLDYANQFLNSIESNRFAHLQLHSALNSNVTEPKFNQAVDVHKIDVPTMADAKDEVYRTISSYEIRNWIQDCLNKKESVCVLAHARQTVKSAYKALEDNFPNEDIESLVPSRPYTAPILSTFVANRYQDVMHFPLTVLQQEIVNYIHNEYDSFMPARYKLTVQNVDNVLQGWITRSTPVFNVLLDRIQQNTISIDQFHKVIKQCLIDYEVSQSAIAQSMASGRNNKHKENAHNVNLLVSTIHSAKGMEFDHTIIVIPSKTNYLDQETMRMYYVALTRAKISEKVLVISNDSSCIFKMIHENVINQIRAQTTQNASASGD